MATTFKIYPGDGTTTLFNLNFDYLSRSHVFVEVDGVETEFTFNSATTVALASAPANGALVRVFRQTPKTPLVDFNNGETTTEEQLDTVTLQALYLAEETADAQGETLSVDPTNVWPMRGLVVRGVGTPTEDGDAVTKLWAETAMSSSVQQANIAKSQAESHAAAALQSRNEAAATLASFDLRYLGAGPADPSTAEVATGVTFFNTTIGEMRVFNGTQWVSQSGDNIARLAAQNNLSELEDVGEAQENLGLGTAATLDIGAFSPAMHTHSASAITSGLLDPARISWASETARGTVQLANETELDEGTEEWRIPNVAGVARMIIDRGGFPLAAPVVEVTSPVLYVEFDLDHTKFRRFFPVVENAIPALNATALVMQLSPDGGVTWRGTNYYGVYTVQGVAVAKQNALYLSDVAVNSVSARGGASVKCELRSTGSATMDTTFDAQGQYAAHSGNICSDYSFGGSYLIPEIHNRIRFGFAGATWVNIVAGRFTLRGEPV